MVITRIPTALTLFVTLGMTCLAACSAKKKKPTDDLAFTAYQDLLSGAPQTGGSASFTGNVNNTALTPAAAFYDILGSTDGQIYRVYVVLSSDAAHCPTTVQQNNETKNATSAILTLSALDANNIEIPIATAEPFIIDPSSTAAGNTASFEFASLGADCSPALSDDAVGATAGSVRLSKVDKTGAAGTFDAVVGVQRDAVSGSFEAVPCPGFGRYLEDVTIVPGCQ